MRKLGLVVAAVLATLACAAPPVAAQNNAIAAHSMRNCINC